MNNSILSEDGKILTIPSTTEGIPPYEIYIRDCWIKIYNLICNGYKHKRIEDFVVTGSPGIGKSMFCYYMMWRCMKELPFQGFYWERFTSNVIHYSPIYGTSIIAISSPQKFENIPHFIDREGDAFPSDIGACYRVVFSLPYPRRVRQLLRMEYAQGFIHPPWSFKESFDAYSRIRKYQEMITEKIFKRQFKVYGGIPRYLFHQSSKGNSIMKLAIYEKHTLTIKYPSLLKKDYETYLIMHLYPENMEMYSFYNAKYQPASPWVSKEMMKLNKLLMDYHSIEYIRGYQRPFESSGDWIFHKYFLKVLQDQGYDIRQLKRY